jgi:hypothetical protein
MLAVTTTDPIADCILAAGFAFTVYLGLRNGHKANQTNDKLNDQATKVNDVHNLVNAQLSDAVTRKDVAEARTAVLEKERDQPNG